MMTPVKILPVEDESIIAQEIQERLEQFGYHVPTVAYSGEEAIEMAEKTSPDLVLMDIKLGKGIDGIEAAEHISKMDIPIIYITAYGDKATLNRAKMTDPYGYLLKPFNAASLQTSVEIAIHKHKKQMGLKKIHKWLEVTLKSIGDAVIATDTDGIVVFANHVAETLLKLEESEIIGADIEEAVKLVNDEKTLIIKQHVTEVIAKGSVICLKQHALITGDDAITYISDSIAPIVDEQGIIIGSVLIFSDVTDQKQEEDGIRQHNEELKVLHAIAQEISQTINLDEILGNAMDKTLELLHLSHGSIHLLDKEGEYLILKIQRGTNHYLAKAISAIKLGEGFVGRMILEGKPIFTESIEKWASLVGKRSLRPMIDERIQSTMCIPLRSKDITLGVMIIHTQDERVFTEAERSILVTVGYQISTAIENAELLKEASRFGALEETDRLKTVLLASVSHELRTPITCIRGIANTLTQPDIQWDRPTLDDFLQTIVQESDRLNHIVTDLMDMSQLETGMMKMEKRRSTLSSVIAQISNHLYILTSKHKLYLDQPYPDTLLHIDETRIGQVITNLVSNAVSYSPENTQITLLAEQVDDKIVVSVVDEGDGIAPANTGKIFDLFYRLESGIVRSKGGSGLGLAICKGILEAHNGDIWVESEVGNGSKFSFSLPLADESS